VTTIEITAWETAEVRDLSLDQARALSSTRAVRVVPSFTPGTWTVSAGPWVGVLRAGDVEVRIRPRITIARLMYLLGYAQDHRAWRDDPVGLDDQPDLWPAMAQVFVRQADSALQRGLLQGYRTEESSQLVMRGRLRESEQLRSRAGLAIPLELRFDEYDVDIAENRILRAATERLLRVPGLDPSLIRRLRHLLSRMADVQRLVPGQTVPATPTSRLNARYRPALALARMVLRSRSVDVLDAGVRATGFLVNMNTVFEDFVTTALTQALVPYGGRCVSQDDRYRLDRARRIVLVPDLVRYGADGKPRAVVDAKYKAEKPAGYPNVDVYQLLAYCTATRLKIGHLVYADGGAETDDVVVPNADVLIRRHALNLALPVASLRAQIAELAAEINNARGPGSVLG
jgi:5-methylcytosine-specific restriction enzyme subunit McrC